VKKNRSIKKRLLFGFAQHIAAALILLILAGVLLETKVVIDTVNGEEIYQVNVFEPNKVFEDSELFHQIFSRTVEDVTRLVVIKGQLETDGLFDPAKPIDVTKYASRKGNGNDCRVTAIYTLDDLIKWGKYGIDYTMVSMPMSDFLNYFETPIYPEQFGIDEYGDLYFKGFFDPEQIPLSHRYEYDIDSDKDYSYEESIYEDDNVALSTDNTVIEYEKILFQLSVTTQEQLNDIIFSYIINVSAVQKDITVARQEDGTLLIEVPMLNCRYETTEGEKELVSCADNWVDYLKLQQNLVETIDSLETNYQQYQDSRTLYHERNSNLKYAVRMMTGEGIKTFTNVSGLYKASESEITEFFEEYRRYFIYYPDSLEFFGNTSLTEDDVFRYVSAYDYAYPDTTHIWIGVDTEYPIEGDAFWVAKEAFQKIVPRISLVAVGILVLCAGWIGIAIYMLFIVGVSYDEEGNEQYYLYKIDCLWTELMLCGFVLFLYGCNWGFGQLQNIVYESHPEGIEQTWWYRYGSFALYGALVSWGICMFLYSFMRRLRGRNLWKQSILCKVTKGLQKVFDFTLSHGNAAVRILVFYNLFLVLNAVGIYLLFHYRDNYRIVFFVIAGIVFLDVLIGMLLFRSSAERNDIVDGIKRIREGEVEYKLTVDNLHGTNREMADAVNNIGEGIRKAVQTSMKDEKMRTDLITNVSHDIKTPLTSIISYVDLLKRMNITEEPIKGYIDILDTKSQRLKQLTDDLVEASKISSGNIKLDREDLNLTELIGQTIGEFSDKLEAKDLIVVFENNTLPAHIYADSRRMWRVIENLFNNICKYALEGTRVYTDMEVTDGIVALSIKNISEQQMNIRPEELTERFIRGDSARSTEGSGLGLSIARSLVEVQGGIFEIQLDGDLFKVVMRFPEYRPDELELIEITKQE